MPAIVPLSSPLREVPRRCGPHVFHGNKVVQTILLLSSLPALLVRPTWLDSYLCLTGCTDHRRRAHWHNTVRAARDGRGSEGHCGEAGSQGGFDTDQLLTTDEALHKALRHSSAWDPAEASLRLVDGTERSQAPCPSTMSASSWCVCRHIGFCLYNAAAGTVTSKSLSHVSMAIVLERSSRGQKCDRSACCHDQSLQSSVNWPGSACHWHST